MAEWLQIDLDTEAAERHERIQGVSVALLVSPYDIPAAVRGFFDESKRRFIVEFKYMGEEPTEMSRQDHYANLIVGKNSRRLYGMELDVEALQAERVEVRIGIIKEVNEALDQLVRKPLSPNRLDNYLLAKDAVLITQDELFLPLLQCVRNNSVKVHM